MSEPQSRSSSDKAQEGHHTASVMTSRSSSAVSMLDPRIHRLNKQLFMQVNFVVIGDEATVTGKTIFYVRISETFCKTTLFLYFLKQIGK